MSGTDAAATAARRGWRRHWRSGAALATAVAGLAVVTLGPAGVAIGAHEYSQRQAQAALAGQPQVGIEVRDGPVGFLVHSIHCGRSATAVNGQLCEVTVRARNTGRQPVTVPGTEQKLHSAQGTRFQPAGVAPDPFGALAPGAAATARIAFDLPPRASVRLVELHAGPYTPGTLVAVDGPPLPLLVAGD